MGRSAHDPDAAGKYLIRKRGEAVRRHRLSLFFYWLTSLPFGQGFETINIENNEGGPENDCSVLDL